MRRRGVAGNEYYELKTRIHDRLIDLKVDKAELDKRRKAWKRPEPRIKEGYMARYAAMVTSAAGGAVFKPDLT